MIRTTARLCAVGLAAMTGLLLFHGGPRSEIPSAAAAPDVYNVSAMSSVVDTRSYQTGSPVDPAPAVNTAIPLASISADNGPKAEAHAAFVEPPATAQAATGLQNIPVPYPTQVEALCAACSAPVVRDAEGQVDQSIDGARVRTGGGHAHAEADTTSSLADGSNGFTSVGPLDQVSDLYNALVYDLYSQVIDKPGSTPPPAPLNSPPPCQPGPAPVGPVCPSTLPLVNTLVQTGVTEAHTTMSTTSAGTVVDTVATARDLQLVDGLITVASVVTEVRTTGDGTDKGTTISARNDISGVCVGGDCSYSITADGICKQVGGLCANDPVNQGLRSQGINVCRLGTSTSHSGTNAVGTAAGIIVEFHARTVNGSSSPDPTYYANYGGACEPLPPTPHADFDGISSYAVVGESSAQATTASFPACDVCGGSGLVPLPASGNGGSGATLGGTTTTSFGSGGTAQGGALPRTRVAATTAGVGIAGLRERRGLLLAVFGLLELVMLTNLTATALARRAA